jgi:hypothetical protein
MFTEMINNLKVGVLPDPAPLSGRCRAALSKKLALVSQPPTYWINDPKRNPVTEHLLWAILLLGDPDLLDVVIGIILMEQEETDGLSAEKFMQQSINHLLELAPDGNFRQHLQRELAK